MRGCAGGLAFIYDPERSFGDRYNPELVDVEPLDHEDRSWLAEVVEQHRRETGSAVAGRLLADWDRTVLEMVKVVPHDYRRVMEATERALAHGESVEAAVMAVSHG